MNKSIFIYLFDKTNSKCITNFISTTKNLFGDFINIRICHDHLTH